MVRARCLCGPGLAVAMAVVAVAVLAGCASVPGAWPTVGPLAAAPASPTGPNDIGADLPNPQAYPSDDAASRTAAQTAAADTMAAFVQVDLDPDTWLSQLSAHLSPTARAAYVGTDPLEVPARGLTGPARYEGSTSAYLATVVVPTDVGDYRLLLVREGQGAPWLAETVTPPDGMP